MNINEAEASTVVQETTQEVQQPQQPAPAPETKAEVNLRIMRERWEAAEREKNELANRLKQWEEQQRKAQPYNNYQAETPTSSNFNIAIDDDALVDGKVAKTLAQQIQQTQRELQEARQQAAITMAETYAAQRFPDFKSIVTEENLKNLQALHPDDFHSIMANPDPKSRFVTAYNMIKNYGVSENESQYITKRIEDIKAKPKQAASAGASIPDNPLSRVGDYDRRILSKEQKKLIQARLAEYRKTS